MKLVATIQLKPTPAQADALRETLERCNAACNWISEQAWTADTFRRFPLHYLAYHPTRARFVIAANLTRACIAKVAQAYKTDQDRQRTFRKHAAHAYDKSVVRLCANDVVSLWTVAGRLKIPYVCGAYQRTRLASRQGEADLMLIKGKWYLAFPCEVSAAPSKTTTNFLGVDFGLVNLAYDSQGRSYTGADVERVRQRLAKRKAGLQKRGTKAAKRRLKKLSGKEAQFRKHVNHCISKEIVATAERSQLAIAVEDLKHIRRKRVKASKALRNRLHSWSFAQLRTFVTYKATLKGIPLLAINPRDTSRTCPCCGTVDKANRKTQAVFSCIHCGHTEPADFVAATNIVSVARAALSNTA